MRLLLVFFRAQFRNSLVEQVHLCFNQKNILNKNGPNFYSSVAFINYCKMPKRKIDDAQTETKKDDQKKTTKKSSAKSRGKVSKNPSVESKSDTKSETSSVASNDKEPVDAVKKPRGRPKREVKEKEEAPKEKPKTKEVKETKAKSAKVTKAKNTKKVTINEPTELESKDESIQSKEEPMEKDEQGNFKISSWNVDGLRAWIKKGGLEFIHTEKPDVLCLQETKCREDKLPAEVNIEGYKTYWVDSEKDGYAGVGLYSRTEPLTVAYGIGDDSHDSEGRMITAEYEKFYVISVYVPNAGRGLVTLDKRLDWNTHFRNYVAELDKKKPVIICGDMNVSHKEIDLANPKTNQKNAGFTKEEREGMTEFLGDGYIDTFRHFYPDKTQAYTFWSYMRNARAKNIGWRLDYFIVSKRFIDNVCDSVIRSQVMGSDHCPIVLFLSI